MAAGRGRGGRPRFTGGRIPAGPAAERVTGGRPSPDEDAAGDEPPHGRTVHEADRAAARPASPSPASRGVRDRRSRRGRWPASCCAPHGRAVHEAAARGRTAGVLDPASRGVRDRRRRRGRRPPGRDRGRHAAPNRPRRRGRSPSARVAVQHSGWTEAEFARLHQPGHPADWPSIRSGINGLQRIPYEYIKNCDLNFCLKSLDALHKSRYPAPRHPRDVSPPQSSFGG